MWPGSISIASSKIPLGGTGLFAFLAMAGDLGASIGPAAIGIITQNAGDNMKAGMLAGCVFPVILIASLCLIKYMRLKKQRELESATSSMPAADDVLSGISRKMPTGPFRPLNHEYKNKKPAAKSFLHQQAFYLSNYF